MARILIACLMCLLSNWCRAEIIPNNSENSLKPLIESDKKPSTHWRNEKMLTINDLILPNKGKKNVRESRSVCDKKKKKKASKYLVPILLGWLLIKSILVPIALKALAVMSGKAVVLSFMSLILAAIMGLRRMMQGPPNNGGNGGNGGGGQPSFTSYGKYNRNDYLNHNRPEINESYDYYYNDGHHRR